MMTLRQVEVIRAVMVTGTIGGAARLLNVSAPGISRLVKYAEKSLGVCFFQRQNGRYFPTPEARNIFEQINGVCEKMDDLTEIISKIGRGDLSELRIGYQILYDREGEGEFFPDYTMPSTRGFSSRSCSAANITGSAPPTLRSGWRRRAVNRGR
jgi:hypothetical protein